MRVDLLPGADVSELHIRLRRQLHGAAPGVVREMLREERELVVRRVVLHELHAQLSEREQLPMQIFGRREPAGDEDVAEERSADSVGGSSELGVTQSVEDSRVKPAVDVASGHGILPCTPYQRARGCKVDEKAKTPAQEGRASEEGAAGQCCEMRRWSAGLVEV